ncbi:MAG TPA: MarR family transcriptional regulator [Burkholderiales bacterium]|nr:MarR family transcriptional regulator [Burkholderiales bacterium]
MGSKLLEVKQSGGAANRRAARTRQAPGLGVLPGLIGYQLRLAQRAIFADFADTVGASGISPGLFGILVVIGENPGLTQQALADAAHLDRSSVVTVIDKLEDRGLVERRAADRRSNGLFLAAKGSALLRGLKRKVARHERRVVENLSARERAQLVALLQRILPHRR